MNYSVPCGKEKCSQAIGIYLFCRPLWIKAAKQLSRTVDMLNCRCCKDFVWCFSIALQLLVIAALNLITDGFDLSEAAFTRFSRCAGYWNTATSSSIQLWPASLAFSVFIPFSRKYLCEPMESMARLLNLQGSYVPTMRPVSYGCECTMRSFQNLQIIPLFDRTVPRFCSTTLPIRQCGDQLPRHYGNIVDHLHSLSWSPTSS